MKNRFLILLIASQLSSFGSVLRSMDSDNKGNDDVLGTILQLSGNALQSFSNNDDKGFKKFLKLAADTIYDFLGLLPLGGGSVQ